MTARSSVISRFANMSAAPPVDEDAREAFGGEWQARAHPAMLVVILKNGDEHMLAYPLLRRAYKREGGRKWELVFDDCTVVFTGRNLGKKLSDMLRMQRLSFLKEGNLIEEELTPEDKAFIDTIEIEEKES